MDVVFAAIKIIGLLVVGACFLALVGVVAFYILVMSMDSWTN